MKYTLSKQVKDAINNNKPVLALESTIIASGMPYPENIGFYNKAVSICGDLGVVPATVAIIKGEIHVGLNSDQLEYIATNKSVYKISKREIGVCLHKKLSGATTVSSTSHIARSVGVRVFSTGGIGGVHRGYNNTMDMSQDLLSLQNTPIIIVSSGVKSFLNVEKTVEALETMGVTQIGYKTNRFPLFYSTSSNIVLSHSVNGVADVVGVYKNNISCDIGSSVLVLNPVPKKHEIPSKIINAIISKSIIKMKKNKIVGKDTTPFLLAEISRQTKNKSLSTNISLALNNIQLGAEIASSF